MISILAAVNLNPRVAQADGWRILFFFGAGCSALACIVRLLLPESTSFAERQRKAREDSQGLVEQRRNWVFVRELGKMLKGEWIKCIFGIILMS